MKRKICAVLAALILMLCSSCTDAPALTRTVTALDTVCSVSLYDGGQTLADASVQWLYEYEALWSRTVPSSDVAKLNSANGTPIAVQAQTYALLKSAQQYTALTDGAFDITTASLTDLWKASEQADVLPDEAALAAACQTVGGDKITFQEQTVSLANGTSIDPGGIAKGAIADRVAERLREGGCTSAILDFGGNIVALGAKPNGEPFQIGIADPRDSEQLIATVAVRDRAVVTSGSYERGYTIAGHRYSHILDPQTGYPVQNDLLSVTIITSSAMQADALSTACFVMGYETAQTLIASLDGVEAVFVKADGTVIATADVVLV